MPPVAGDRVCRSASPILARDPRPRQVYGRHMTFQRITVSAEVMGGVPCIRGLRIPVAAVVVMIADGITPDEVVAELPDPTKEDVSEACTSPRSLFGSVNCRFAGSA